jgi:Na+-translocating ferredoxin:NAD+ oxidoreductase RnfC subunit
MQIQSKAINYSNAKLIPERIRRIEEQGIVGCGGAGFPAAMKLQARAPLVIVNAAECEPLLHKDKELLLHHSDLMLRGLRVAMEQVGAEKAWVGIKEKYKDVIAALRLQLSADVGVQNLKDCYPAGDEFVLVYDVTGKIIPPGGLPLDVGCVVFNVETLINIGMDRPVTHKYLTVAGAVNTPVTIRVPIGTSIGEVIDAAGGTTIPDFHVFMGGVMMARLAAGLDEPVTKTTGGIIVLPSTHNLVARHRNSWKRIERIAKAACDQCRYCTEFCPRYLLGHPIQPHRAMSAVGFSGSRNHSVAGVLSCCECNLCSLYACPENLDPKNICAAAKPAERDKKMFWSGDPATLRPHPLNHERRVPMKRLMARLGLNSYNNIGPLVDRPLNPRHVVLPLKQHSGRPAAPVVKPGDAVRAGALIAAPATPGELGVARIHASIDGIVRSVNGAVIIEGEK